MEPENLGKGERIFDVVINGQTVFSRLDIAGETGAQYKALEKDVGGVGPALTIELQLIPRSAKPPLFCGVEIIPKSE